MSRLPAPGSRLPEPSEAASDVPFLCFISLDLFYGWRTTARVGTGSLDRRIAQPWRPQLRRNWGAGDDRMQKTDGQRDVSPKPAS